MPLDYSQTYIYKLCCRDISVTGIYVGMTTNFEQRKRLHRGSCTTESCKSHYLLVYTFIREHGGWSNWDMVLVDTVNAASKLEAHKAEREYIESLGAVLHKVVPGRTKPEYDQTYYQTHKEAKQSYQAQYRAMHRQQRAENAKQYRAKKKLDQDSAP